MTYNLLKGNNLELLPTLADNSIDAIVTDPPYELGFMGKKWDSSGIAYDVELWRECLRVLKPGGHLLAFSGSRTYHRMTVAIEDAGFEIRDMISWISNKTFPKSLNISKAIDKTDANEIRKLRNLEFVNWMRTTGITPKQINQATKTQMSNHYLGFSQPAIATADLFDKLRPYLPEVPKQIEDLVRQRTVESENFKSRKIIGQQNGVKSENSTGHGIVPGGKPKQIKLDITAPATPEAQKWEGWGTALKPTVEPIVMARKPLIGTVAENVLTYGTGGLNIDGTRIGTDVISTHNAPKGTFAGGEPDRGSDTDSYQTHVGRWPANVIFDEDTAGLLDEQSGKVRITSGMKKVGSFSFAPGQKTQPAKLIQGKETKGGASRFFYVARASKRDRNEGLDNSNAHPTVKPTDLMRYLIKLITPPGGTVLDPFTGSGSTGKAAILEGFDFIGIELTEDYWPIIEGRLKHAEAQVAEEKEKAILEETEKLF
jgi:DNA modification methylase